MKRLAALLVVSLALGSRADAQTGKPAHVDAEGFPLPAEVVRRLGSARLRTTYISELVYAAGGKRIVSAVGDPGKTTIEVWDTATGKLLHSIPGKERAGGDSMVCPRMGKLVHYCADGIVRTIDAESGKEVRRAFPTAKGGTGPVFSPDGALLAVSARSRDIRLIELPSGKERWHAVTADGWVVSMAFSADNKVLALAGEGGAIRLIDVTTGARCGKFQTPLEQLFHVAISQDGTRLIATGGNVTGPVIVWDLPARKEVCRLQGEVDKRHIFCAAFTPDGRHAAVGGRWKDVVLYETETGKEVRRFTTHAFCTHLAFTPDGKTLLVGSSLGAISQWDVTTGRCLPASADPLTDLVVSRFTPNGKHVIAMGTTYAAYDWRTGAVVRRFPPIPTRFRWKIDLAPNAGLLAYPESDERITVRDTTTGRERFGVAGKPRIGWSRPRFTPDSRRLITTRSSGEIDVWDTASGMRQHELKGHRDSPFELAIAPNNRWLASASRFSLVGNGDQSIRLWDLGTGRLRHQLLPNPGDIAHFAFSADSTLFVVAAGGPPNRSTLPAALYFFDVASGRQLWSIPTADQLVTFLAFTPDGHSVVIGTHSEIRLWELATRAERHRFIGHRTTVRGLAFSPDGSLLAASSTEAPLYLWDVYGKHGTAPAAAGAPLPKALWADLAGTDAKAGFQAVRKLIAHPAAAVALVREHLKAVAPGDRKRVQQWLHDLDSEDFDTRQAAYAGLEQAGDRIETPLRAALKTGLGLEAHRRIAALLARCEAPTPERLAGLRALEALEQIATPDAVELLEALAAGSRDARLTRTATAVLDRVRQR